MSGVGEMVASALVKQIAGKLGVLASDEVKLQWKFKEEVVKLADKMEDLEAVMLDADEKLRRGGTEGQAVGRWLTKVKSVAYDAEDVLDELDANELIRKVQPKLNLFFSWNNPLYQRINMPRNIKNVRKKIEDTQKDGQTLALLHHQSTTEESRANDTVVAIGDSSIQIGMVGRHTERRKIIRLLKNEAREDISIIPIVGLAGVGKSKLVESVLADDSVNAFDIQAWVHVSEKFDLKKIGTIILKSVNRNINLDGFDVQLLNNSLKEELANIKYLIVLDDIWEDDIENLENLKKMLRYGRKGSKIIVTTRDQSVVQTLSTGFLAREWKVRPVPQSDQIFLDVLLPGECWDLIKQRAFGPEDDDMDVKADIGKQIAEKCGGLPLVANALGKVLFDLKTITEWENIRDKVDLGLRGDHQNKTLENLMLSYYYMKKEFKMCFTYLAVFPKSLVMDASRLIQQWIALGYIGAEDDGKRCINYLLGMSFLQITKSSVSQDKVDPIVRRELNMHDLVHDLVSIITVDEVLVLDANSTQPRSWNRIRYCRHAQLIKYKNQPKVFKYLPSMVRSMHLRGSEKLQLPENAFSRSKYIRVLDLSGRSVQGQPGTSNIDTGRYSVEGQSSSSKIVLPSSIHQSKLLRYLDATALPITSLPKSFHTLQYMQTLILSKCSLEALPDNICTLQKLSYLDLSGNDRLNKLPVSFGNLYKLSFLNLLGCSLLQELPESTSELTCLRHLDMSECPTIETLPDRFSLPKLIFLNMSGCSKLAKLPESVGLESLEHLNLSSCHKLEILPQDIGSLKRLAFFDLSDCYKLSVLPGSFCQLIRLKVLDLSDCHDLKELPDRFGEISELHSLNLTSCCKLQLLPESFSQLLKLKHLNLSYCMRIRNLPSKFGDLKLHVLDISCTLDLLDFPDSLSSMTSLTQFKVTSASSKLFRKYKDIKKQLNLPARIVHHVRQIENRGCSNIVDLDKLTCGELHITRLQNVRNPEDAERAKLRDKPDLRLLWLGWECEGDEDKNVLERLMPPRTLERFFIYGYKSKDFPNWISQISSFLPSITLLALNGLETCDTLPPFGQLPNLRYLGMENLPNIRKVGMEFYGENRPCMKLRALVLRSMENLVEWWTTHSGEENGEFLIPNLHFLESKDCPKLKFLPYPPRSMIWSLENSGEVIPEGGFRNLSSSALPFDMAIRNSNFSPDKWDRLQHFPSLESFLVKSCSGFKVLPQAMRYLTSVRKLRFLSLKELEELESIECLPCLEHLEIVDCPKLRSLHESMKNLTSLRVVWLKDCNGLEVLPEWLGQLTSLQEINIVNCFDLTSLPESIRNLSNMKELYIQGCPTLVERCQGEDAYMISHIPRIILHGKTGVYVLIDGVRVAQDRSTPFDLGSYINVVGESPWSDWLGSRVVS